MVSSNPTCGCGEDAICNETELKCDPCCRCVPQRLCATFESYGCDCDGSSAFLPLDSDGQYTSELICGVEIIDLTVLLHSENDKCYWRVVSEKNYIDELFEIGPELQSCERPELILPFSFAECGGTLTITRQELRKLPPRLDDAGCPSEPFCGDCNCTCECLCVTITDYGGVTSKGEICNVSYPDEGPVWEGTVGQYDLSLALGRDVYGECILTLTVDGTTAGAVFVGDCSDLTATFELTDGTIVFVSCKKCSCDEEEKDGCCTDRSCPGLGAVNPLPASLTVELSASFNEPPSGVPPASGFTPPANSNCYNFSFPIYLTNCGDNGIRFYFGTGVHSCSWCNTTYTIRITVELTCFGLLTIKDVLPVGDCGISYLGDAYRIECTQHSCDPILLSGEMNRCLDCRWQCNLGLWEPFPGVEVPVIAMHSPFCLSAIIYETPET